MSYSKRFLVTGSSGFVGKRFIDLLDTNNINYSLLNRSTIGINNEFKWDMEGEEFPKDSLLGIDIVVHIAGYAHDTRSKGEKEMIFNINYRATKIIAEESLKAGVKKFIFISSTKVSDNISNDYCIDEATDRGTDGAYGISKKKSEDYLLRLAKEADMQICILRPSLVYGPSVKGHLRQMIKAIEKKWFPPLPKIQNKISMVHVDDLANSILHFSKRKDISGEVFIITDGLNYNSRDIYEIIYSKVNGRLPQMYIPMWVFKLFGILFPFIGKKFTKLFSSNCYNSSKLLQFGFKPQKNFKQFDEKIF